MSISALLGKTLRSVKRTEDVIDFVTESHELFRMHHIEDCCEYVSIEDVTGDFADLIGSPILVAESSAKRSGDTDDGSETWTFYKLATVKGHVDIRWYGSSNGHYSEEVTFEKIEDTDTPLSNEAERNNMVPTEYKGVLRHLAGHVPFAFAQGLERQLNEAQRTIAYLKAAPLPSPEISGLKTANAEHWRVVNHYETHLASNPPEGWEL